MTETKTPYVIKADSLTYNYDESENKKPVIDKVSLDVKKGEFIAILGHNGCGKSTLARHLNALLHPKSGTLYISGMDASDKENLWSIRKSCGMVFQNPDNQFVSSVIEEDIAFGPDNYDVPEEETKEIIKKVLHIVGMSGYEKKSPHMLSGGQKQRIAIAGVLAIDPEIMILDEVTSMLDPEGRKSILSLAKRLNKEHGKTVIMITHYIEEALRADRVILMKKGRILRDADARDVLTDTESLSDAGLIPPLAVKAYHDMKESLGEAKQCPLTPKELVEYICQSL